MYACSIIVGDGETPDEGTLCSLAPDTGTYNCASTLTGRYIFVQFPTVDSGYLKIKVVELRAYGLRNLVDTASILYAPAHSDSLHTGTLAEIQEQTQVSNLITNVTPRSLLRYQRAVNSENDWVSFYSCYTTGHQVIDTLDDKIFKLTYELAEYSEVGAVLILPYVKEAEADRLSDLRVFVGDSDEYAENTECPGGPYSLLDVG